MKDLPVNVLSNIVSYTHGEPEYVKIKHSEALKRIQNKYKISRLGPKMTRHLKSIKKIYKIEYCIIREGVSFSLTSIEDIITEEQEELLSLIYEEVEDVLFIELNLILKFNWWQNSQKRNMEK